MEILEHQQHAVAAAGVREQVGDGDVQPVARRVRVRGHRLGQPVDDRSEVGNEADELAADPADVRPQLVGRRRPDELFQRLDHRLVRRTDDAVAVAVEHQGAVGPCLVGQLADEPALAPAWLAAQQGDAPPLSVGPRQQRAERRELARPPDERERRLQPELAGESADGHPEPFCHG